MKIEIQGCRWLHKTHGNTYHAIKCYVDDELVYTSKTYEYGYENQYIESGLRELVKLKILPMKEGESFSYRELEKKYGLECSVIDVNRKKDLKAWMNEPNN
tara:strand:+ start:275 stop:577 length:303 start_codon:yes stop_codon:yes gene_type:complete